MKPRLRVCLAASDDYGRIFLIQHIRQHANYWVLPGGGVDEGEILEKALVREIKEELNLECSIEKLIAIGELITPYRHVVDFFYSGKIDQQASMRINRNEGIGQVKWVEKTLLGTMDIRPREIIPILEKEKKLTSNVEILGKYEIVPDI